MYGWPFFFHAITISYSLIQDYKSLFPYKVFTIIIPFYKLFQVKHTKSSIPRATFQDALSFMLDGRLQLLQLLHQTAQHQS